MKTGLILFLTAWLLVSISGCSGLAYSFSEDPKTSYTAGLGDLDLDGDRDAFLANGANEEAHPDIVWFNQGGLQGGPPGKFSASDLELGRQNSRSVALGDLDGDQDLDALVGTTDGLQVYINQGGRQEGGSGNFSVPGGSLQLDDTVGIWRIALGDLDNDGDLDAYVGNCCGGVSYEEVGQSWIPSHDLVWLNDGEGHFADSGQRLGSQGTEGTALGDLDNDGDLDAFTANDYAVIDAQGNLERDQPDRIWLNDGAANFSDSHQRLGASQSTAVGLGDLDSDSDLDAFVVSRGPAWVWLNDGAGKFSDSHQRLGDLQACAVFLGDLDGDGDLDALVSSTERAEVWLNDGRASFRLSGQQLDLPNYHAIALGDLDGDGDLDLFAGYLNKRYSVWWNDGFGRLGKNWR